MTDDPYAVLGVPVDAAHDDIRRAWLHLARRHHPDHGGDAAAMQAVNEAWAVLGDPARRRRWDDEHGGSRKRWSEQEASAAADEWAAEGDRDIDADPFDPRSFAPPRRAAVDLVPVGLFASAIGIGCVGLVLDEPAMLGFALFVFFLSCVAVAAVALLTMRRAVRAARHR